MSVPQYDEYRGVPPEYIPTRRDAVGLDDIVRQVKNAIRIRHDFNTALEIAAQANGQRRLRPVVPQWESAFAQSSWPGSKTMKGLAAEHKRVAQEAQNYALTGVKENAKLARLVRDNLRSLFPDIGFNEFTGEAVQRLRKGTQSVLSIFHPLGVEDYPRLIKLLLRPPTNYQFYW